MIKKNILMLLVLMLLGCVFPMCSFTHEVVSENHQYTTGKTIIPFSYMAVELSPTSKKLIDTLMGSWQKNENNINEIRLYTYSCPWENYKNPDIGVLRCKKIVDYLCENYSDKVDRHQIIIIDDAPIISNEEIEKEIRANPDIKESDKEQVCIKDNAFGVQWKFVK
ncbi:MAG: hypothetical protein ACOZCO_02640 [Bacteroidota bacterium]